MKCFILAILMFLMSTWAARAEEGREQPYVLSDRVGSEIDRYERDYFGLFPRIGGFRSATTTVRNDGSVAFRVRSFAGGMERDSTMVVAADDVAGIAALIDDYETKVDRGRRMVGKAADIKLFVVRLTSGERTESQIAYIGDSLLVFWPGDSQFCRSRLHQIDQVLHYSEIGGISYSDEMSIAESAELGALIGAPVGAAIYTGIAADSEFIDPSWETALFGALVCGGAGAVVGLVVGIVKEVDASCMEVGGSRSEHAAARARIRRSTMFPVLPPPEIRALMFEHSQLDKVR